MELIPEEYASEKYRKIKELLHSHHYTKEQACKENFQRTTNVMKKHILCKKYPSRKTSHSRRFLPTSQERLRQASPTINSFLIRDKNPQRQTRSLRRSFGTHGEGLIQSSQIFHMPHNRVGKESSTTTELHDASEKTTPEYPSTILGCVARRTKRIFRNLDQIQSPHSGLVSRHCKTYINSVSSTKNINIFTDYCRKSHCLFEALPRDPQHLWCGICRVPRIKPLSLSAETTVTSFAITFGMHVHDLLTGASFQMEVKFLQGALIEHLASWFPHPQMDFKW